MKRMFAILLGLALFTALPGLAQFKMVQRAKLGGEGGWDDLTYDNVGHRLFITRGSHVMVVDGESLKMMGDIPNLSGIHGVALDQDLGHGFVSNGGDNTVTVFDLKTLNKLASVTVGERPDAIMFEPFTKRVFTFNARGKDISAIDPATNKVAGSIALGGKPEFPVNDGKGKAYVNIEDKSEIAEFDPAKLTLIAHWSIVPCQEPSALAFDVQHHRLFAGCDNKMMAVVDSDSGKVITTVPIGEGVDGGRFNPKTQQIFMSCGEGVLTVIHEDSPDKYSVVQNVPTVRGARTMALDEESNTAYLVTAQRSETPPPPGQRPTMVPGSFEVLVVRAQ
jgi:YVTN family beta-propeller protein